MQGVTLVNKMIQVSGVQFCNTASVHCIPTQTHASSVPTYPFHPGLPPPTPSSGSTTPSSPTGGFLLKTQFPPFE